MNQDSSKGVGAILSAIAIIAALCPKITLFVLLSAQAPNVANVLPYILGPLGIIGGMLSHPPAWLRGPWDDFKHWFNVSVLGKKVTP